MHDYEYLINISHRIMEKEESTSHLGALPGTLSCQLDA